MPYRILHYTWSIRTASDFVVPLPIAPARYSANATTFNNHSLEAVATDMTEFLRLCHQRENNEIDDGTYVSMDWIALEKAPSESTSCMIDKDNDLGGVIRRHLCIDIVVMDETVAHVILCNPEFSKQQRDGEGDMMIRCAYALVRGARPAFDTVLQWIESNTGCVFGTFQPRSNQIARALSQWTYQQQQQVLAVSKTMNQTTKDGTTTMMATQTKNRPFEVTFSVPVPDLSQLTLTVPPVALARLCRDMEFMRQRRHKSSASTDKNTDVDADVDSSGAITAADERLPILKALHHYVKETYNFDLQHCPLIRASSALAVLGCDGRVKPLDERSLSVLLNEIQSLIEDQMRLSSTSISESVPNEDGGDDD